MQSRFPEASVALEDVRRPLTVLFRGLGGAPSLRLAVAGETALRIALRFASASSALAA